MPDQLPVEIKQYSYFNGCQRLACLMDDGPNVAKPSLRIQEYHGVTSRTYLLDKLQVVGTTMEESDSKGRNLQKSKIDTSEKKA